MDIILFVILLCYIGWIIYVIHTWNDKECGSDGCSKDGCGTCKDNEICKNNKCVISGDDCVPNCKNKECGSDGCSKDGCGTCNDTELCNNSECISPFQIPTSSYYKGVIDTAEDSQVMYIPYSDDTFNDGFPVLQIYTHKPSGKKCLSRVYYKISYGKISPYRPSPGKKDDQFVECYPPGLSSTSGYLSIGGTVKFTTDTTFNVIRSYTLDGTKDIEFKLYK